MALTGVHITFGYSSNSASSPNLGGNTLPFQATASETMASAGTSTISAPSNTGALLSISASAAIFYVTGPDPDTNVGPLRYYDPSFSSREDIFVNPGDKFAWIAA